MRTDGEAGSAIVGGAKVREMIRLQWKPPPSGR